MTKKNIVMEFRKRTMKIAMEETLMVTDEKNHDAIAKVHELGSSISKEMRILQKCKQ